MSQLVPGRARISGETQTHTHTHTHTTHTHTHTHIHTHTHTHTTYSNPRCACAPRVNKQLAAALPAANGKTMEDKSTHNSTTIVSLAMMQIKAFPFNPSATCWLLQQLIIPATVETFSNQNSHCQLTSQRGSCIKPFLSLSDSELIKVKGLMKLEWTSLLSHQLPRMYCVWQWHMHDVTCVKSSVHCHDSCKQCSQYFSYHLLAR